MRGKAREGVALSDALTITAANRPRTGYEQYEQWIVMCPDDNAGEWFIYGSAEGVFDEVQGPFSTKGAAVHFLTHSLQRLCPRYAAIIE